MNKINNTVAILLLLICTAITSCEYQEIGEAEYPAESIYLPVAVNGNYLIDNLFTKDDTIYKFKINAAANEFNIPLAVYRAGIETKSSFQVDIKADADTVIQKYAETLQRGDTVLLPQEKYELISSIQMKKGERVAPFTLKVDLDYLTTNADKRKLYVLAVQISSAECTVSPQYNTAFIFIPPLQPVADFSYVGGASARQIDFTNTSSLGINVQWDFGDGNTSTDKSPSYKFSSAGVYPVKLTVTGITGLTDEKILDVIVE